MLQLVFRMPTSLHLLTTAFSSLKRFSPLALASSSPGQWRWCGDTNSNRLFFLEEGTKGNRLQLQAIDHHT